MSINAQLSQTHHGDPSGAHCFHYFTCHIYLAIVRLIRFMYMLALKGVLDYVNLLFFDAKSDIITDCHVCSKWLDCSSFLL